MARRCRANLTENFMAANKVIIRCANTGSIHTPSMSALSVEERVRPAAQWKPEATCLNMGSTRFELCCAVYGFG